MASDKGWFKVQRKYTNSSRWLNGSPFDERSAYIDLLNMANYEDSKITPKGMQSFVIPKNTVFRSLQYLCDRWKWSKGKVRRYLKALSDDNLITLNGTAMGMLISIIDGDLTDGDGYANGHASEYTGGHAGGHTGGTPNRTASGHAGGTHNKKERSIKKVIKNQRNQQGTEVPSDGSGWDWGKPE